MKCSRCGRGHLGPSWYCPNCGAPMLEPSVAGRSRGPQLPPVVRWSLAVSLSGLLLVTLTLVVLTVAGTSTGARRPRTSAWHVRDVSPSPTQGVAAAGASAAVRPGISTPATGPRQRSGPDTPPPSGWASRSGSPSPPPPDGSLRERAPADNGSDTPSHSVASPPWPQDTSGEPAPAWSSGAPERVPTWRLPRVVAPLQLDAWLDDWPGQAMDIVHPAFGAESWDGPADVSGRAFAAWDDSALSLGVRVVDDLFFQPAQGAELHLGDSLEIQVDADLPGDRDIGVYNADDWQIGISPGDFAARPPEAYVWRPAGQSAKGIRLSARRLDDGYIVELALPWSRIGFEPRPGAAFGLAVNVSDNDLPQPAQLTLLSSSPLRSWSDPRTFHRALLLGQPSSPPPSR